MIPNIYVGNLVLLAANAFWIDPSGQAPTAPGHEQQFKPGKHKALETPVKIYPVTKPFILALYNNAA